MDRPKIGISSCLLGSEVRYDGGHKHNSYITRTLGEYFEFVPFCPEVAIGLGIPRTPIRLVASDAGPRAVNIQDPTVDYTEALDAYAGKVTPVLNDYCGYLVKKDSPSCGMERVKVYYRDDAPPVREAAGIYTARLLRDHPEIPVEEEGRLMDPGLRENFIERVYALYRWRTTVEADDGPTPARLVDFHTRHKFFMLAHHEHTYRELGRIVAGAGEGDIAEKSNSYLHLFMQGLKHKANPKKNTNVLMHIMGYFKDHLTGEDKAELLELIEAHRQGLVPVLVPITLINHYLKKFPSEYVANQIYLQPHPRELMLRNHV